MREFTADQLYGPEAGPEVDGSPVAVPAGFKKPETMEERIRRFVRNELSSEAAQAGAESFDEANDFDIPDDPVDPSTPFEEFFDPALGRSITPDEFNRYEAIYREQYLRAQAGKIAAEDREAAIREHVEQLRRSRKVKPAAEGGGSPNPPPPPAAGN